MGNLQPQLPYLAGLALISDWPSIANVWNLWLGALNPKQEVSPTVGPWPMQPKCGATTPYDPPRMQHTTASILPVLPPLEHIYPSPTDSSTSPSKQPDRPPHAVKATPVLLSVTHQVDH